MKGELTKEEQIETENLFKNHMSQLDIKSHTIKYKSYHQMFFSGACSTLSTIPPLWGVCLMSGRNIIEERNNKK